jgi:hypothetical protein
MASLLMQQQSPIMSKSNLSLMVSKDFHLIQKQMVLAKSVSPL